MKLYHGSNIEILTFELARRLLDEGRSTDIQSALDIIYNSETYEKLSDERTGLMFQNPGYVYCYLREELTTGRLQ